jgi:hypothetical protein
VTVAEGAGLFPVLAICFNERVFCLESVVHSSI